MESTFSPKVERKSEPEGGVENPLQRGGKRLKSWSRTCIEKKIFFRSECKERKPSLSKSRGRRGKKSPKKGKGGGFLCGGKGRGKG